MTTTNTPMVRLGELIEECDLRNSDNTLTLDAVRGTSIEKKFISTKANMEGVSLTPYKVINQGWFCYVTVTSRNGERISIALYTDTYPALVSSSYIVFRSKDENILLPLLFLYAWNTSLMNSCTTLLGNITMALCDDGRSLILL